MFSRILSTRICLPPCGANWLVRYSEWGMHSAFEAANLSKTFRRWWSRREVQALRGVSLAVEGGSVFGLLGPNGAGKTTLVKIALTIAHPDSGEVRLLGESIRNRSI